MRILKIIILLLIASITFNIAIAQQSPFAECDSLEGRAREECRDRIFARILQQAASGQTPGQIQSEGKKASELLAKGNAYLDSAREIAESSTDVPEAEADLYAYEVQLKGAEEALSQITRDDRRDAFYRTEPDTFTDTLTEASNLLTEVGQRQDAIKVNLNRCVIDGECSSGECIIPRGQNEGYCAEFTPEDDSSKGRTGVIIAIIIGLLASGFIYNRTTQRIAGWSLGLGLLLLISYAIGWVYYTLTVLILGGGAYALKKFRRP